MASEDITKAVIEFAKTHKLGKSSKYKKLHSDICNASKKDRYFGLMGVFKYDHREQRTLVQTFAGRMLLKMTPKAMESCEKAIFSLLPYWDVSAEEVIFYLKDQFGRQKVLLVVTTLKSGSLPERDIALLNTIEYWLGGNEL